MARHSPPLRAGITLLVVLALGLDGAAAAAQSAVATPPHSASSGASAAGTAMLATIEALTAPGMDGRAVGTPGNAKARAWIRDRFTRLGLTPLAGREFEAPFSFASKAGATLGGTNLVAQCPGRRPDLPVLVVSAHYDHLGVRDAQTYHGADDNASGVALLLEIAARCVDRPFERTFVIAAFDAEEQGLQGAKAFLGAPTLPADRIALNMNFDMVSRSDRREIYVAGPAGGRGFGPLLKAPAARASITVKFGHDTGGGQDDWTQQSDHGPFHAAGIPFVYLGVEDHADYHKPSDTADKIDRRFLGDVAAFALDAIDALARAPVFK